MQKSLMNKFTLKILSLVIAILLWLLIRNVQNPVISKYFYDVPVVTKNESFLASNLEIPLLIEGKNTVNVKIKGEKSVVEDITKEDITAVADMTQILSMDTTPRMVRVSVSCKGIEDRNITVSPINLQVDIEKQQSVEKIVAVNVGDTAPDKAYEIGSIKAEPEKVTISGPETLINKIDKVVARIDASTLKETTTEEDSEIKIYDKNGEELTEKQMSYIDIKGLVDNKIKIQAELWKVDQNIKLEAGYTGSPKYGYEVNSVTLVPDTISLAGTDEALKKLAEDNNTLQIPASLIDVSGKSTDFEQTIDITELLPEGTKLARDINSSVNVTVKILPYNSRDYEVSAAEIKVENKPDDIDIVFDQETITARIKARGQDLDELSSQSIQMKIDLKDYKTGEYQVPVTVSLPSAYSLVEDIKVKVKLVPAAGQ